MKDLCFDTALSKDQAKKKLELIFSNDIEFENVVYIKYKKSFTLKSKSPKNDYFSESVSKSIFDFFKVEVILAQKESGVSVNLILKTFVISFFISCLLLLFVWGALVLFNLPPFAQNIYTLVASFFSIYLLFRVYKSNRLQSRIVKTLAKKLNEF